MIEVKNLTKKFGDKTVLDNISVQFETGKTNLIIGQSGSGRDGFDEESRRTPGAYQRSGALRRS